MSNSPISQDREDNEEVRRPHGANAVPNILFMNNEACGSSAMRHANHGNSSSLARCYIRGARRLVQRERIDAAPYESPGTSRQNRLNALDGLPSSPDGFSSDSMIEDHDLSDGMSSVSDLENRINFPAEYGDMAQYGSLWDPLAVDAPKTSNKRFRGEKRIRTGSNSSNSSHEGGGSFRKDYYSNGFHQRSILIDSLQALRRENKFTDIVLVVEDTEIRCHRVILAACSPYFRALLTSSLSEVLEGKIVIPGYKFETLDILVRYAYAETVHISATNAQDVLEAADYFQMDALKKHCEGFLILQVSESNCLGLEQFASLHSLHKLHHKAKKYGLQNFTRVSKQEEFLCLPLHAVARYLADNQLAAACEEHVYEAALRWLEHEESRREDAAVVLRSVRLFYVSATFLFEVVSKNSFFQTDAAAQEIIAEACKYHALGSNEWRHSKLPHTRPRTSSGISEVLVVVGGICNNRRLVYTECYNRLRKEWTLLSDISTPHSTMHSYSVCAHENYIYITGGHSTSGMTVDTVSVYFSCINQWSLLATMHYPRERHGSASVDGAVYVAGGLMASTKNRKKPGVLNSVERYRPKYNRWDKVKPLPKRCYSPGVVSFKDKLYVIGGVSMTEDASNSSKVILDCIQCYDPLTDNWSQLPLGRPLARLSCTTYNQHFYMISNNASSVFRYDPVAAVLEEWKELNQVNVEFAGLATLDHKLVISGGQKGNTTLNHMIMIDFASGDVEEETKMKRSRCMHGCVQIDKYG